MIVPPEIVTDESPEISTADVSSFSVLITPPVIISVTLSFSLRPATIGSPLTLFSLFGVGPL